MISLANKVPGWVQYKGHRHRIAFLLILCLWLVCQTAAAQKKRKVSDGRVHLIHADELRYDQFGANPDAQIVKGKVHFVHQGTQLWCDSAYFYQLTNSVKAFGHVRYNDGDTLTLTCGRAAYDGMSQTLIARENVVLKHRRQTLYCDSLDYNKIEDYAHFFEGGRLVDGRDVLTADWGGYHPDTRQAEFFYDVKMTNGSRIIRTDTLYYDVVRSKAHVVGKRLTEEGRYVPSSIKEKNSTVTTTDAWFDTKTDAAQLFGRSTVVDATREITADSLFHNDKTGLNRGYGKVVYVDKKRRNELHCGHLVYNEHTGLGFATERALLVDYSQKDTLWLHADSIKIFTYHINTDSVYRVVRAFANVRTYRNDVQSVCGLMVMHSKDSTLTLYEKPVVWSGNRQIMGDSIKAFMSDSMIRQVRVMGNSFSIEQFDTKEHYNQVSSKLLVADFTEGKIRRTINIDNVQTVYYPVEERDTSLIGLDYQQTDTLVMLIGADQKMEKIISSKTTGVLYPMLQIPADKRFLPGFVWLDAIRPKDKNDVFRRPGAASGKKEEIESGAILSATQRQDKK